MARKNKPRRFYDYSLLFCVIFLMAFGLVMIYSASSYTAQMVHHREAAYFMKRQFMIASAGLLMAIVISKMDYHWYARFAALAYVVSLVLMLVVTVAGKAAKGRKRWLEIGGASFQPTEMVKVVLIVLLASLIAQLGPKINRPRAIALVVGLSAPLALLVAMNNLSSGIIITGIVFVMLFVATRKWLPFLGCGVFAVIVYFGAGPFATFMEKIGLMKAYQLERVYVWMDPEAYPLDGGFQVLQGLYAIGSGGLVGKGLGESIQKMGFVPEAQNDYIFSIICEELGLFGAVSVILIFLFMIYRFMLIAGNAPDLFGALIVIGVMAHIAIQVILNIAVVTNSIPNTGITLPFISYGGTSVLFLMIEMGMVLSVSNQIKLEK